MSAQGRAGGSPQPARSAQRGRFQSAEQLPIRFNSPLVILTNNTIGTNISGTLAIPNGHDGVALTDGARDNSIGGTSAASSAASPNLISGNTQCGVRIRDGATANYVDGNRIGLNAVGNAAIPNGQAGVCVTDADGIAVGTSWFGVSQYISGWNSAPGRWCTCR